MDPLIEMIRHHLLPTEHNSFRPHLLRPMWTGFFIAVILATEGFLVMNLVVRQTSQNFLAAVVPGEVIALTNLQRTNNGTAILHENGRLDVAAQTKANDMAKRSYFSHVGPDGSEPWKWIQGAGYDYQYAGENLAVRFVDSNDVVNAWMASASHRANITKSAYSDVGVGVAQGSYMGMPATYVVQYLASPHAATGGDLQGAVAAGNNANILDMTRKTIVMYMASIQAEPLVVTEWILGAVVVALVIAIALALLVHIQIQSSQMLATGISVVVFALLLLFSDVKLLQGKPSISDAQSASALSASADLFGVVITPTSAETQR